MVEKAFDVEFKIMNKLYYLKEGSCTCTLCTRCVTTKIKDVFYYLHIHVFL
jgi:hypothetical protein